MSFCSWAKSEKYRDHFDVGELNIRRKKHRSKCETRCVLNFGTTGVYVCPKCEHPLFSSKAKYEHDTPWPAFAEPVQNNSLRKRQENKNTYKV